MADNSSFLTGTVPGRSKSGDKLDPERLKYITENFNGLQGLSSMAGSLILIILRISVAFDTPLVFLPGLVVGIALFIAMLKHLPRYYAQRFGFVQQRPFTLPFTSRQVAFYVVILTVFALILMEMQHAIHPRIDLLTFITAIAMSFAVVGGARGLQRPTVLIIAAAGLNVVLAIVAILPLWAQFNAAETVTWKLINAASPGITLILVGISDHIALTRLLPEAAEDDHD